MTKFEFDDEGAKIVELFNASAGATRRRARISDRLCLQPGQHVLDVGSGPGHQVQQMAASVGSQGRIVGVDATEGSVATASHRCAELDNVTIRLGDVCNLPFEDHEFDAVMSSQVFEYLDDIGSALGEVYRVLRPGGRVLIHDTDWGTLVWNAVNRDRANRILEVWDRHLADPYLPRTFQPMLANAGFTNVGVDSLVQVETSYDPTDVSAILMSAING